MPTSPAPAPEPNSDAPAVTPPAEATTETAANTRRAPSVLNRKQLREIDLAEQLARTAQQPEYAARLEKRKITADFASALLADCAAARAGATSVVAGGVDAKAATQDELAAKQKLIASLRQIQASARQQYQHTQPIQLDAYLIGQDIDASRLLLTQSAETILDLAESERPGGLDTEFLQAVAADRAAYVQCDHAQSGKESGAQKERVARDARVLSIQQRRQQIQFAVEHLWPFREPAHAPIRTEFKMPLKRPYIG